MITKEQDNWIDRFSTLIGENADSTPYLRMLLATSGGDFTFVMYHAGATPESAAGMLILAAKGYATWKEGNQ